MHTNRNQVPIGLGGKYVIDVMTHDVEWVYYLIIDFKSLDIEVVYDFTIQMNILYEMFLLN